MKARCVVVVLAVVVVGGAFVVVVVVVVVVGVVDGINVKAAVFWVFSNFSYLSKLKCFLNELGLKVVGL